MNKDFNDATITAAKGANVSFSGVSLGKVSNLHFDGVNFTDSTGADGRLSTSSNSSDVSVRNATFDGMTGSNAYGSGNGVVVNKSDGFVLENTTIKGVMTGVWLGSTTDLTIRNNHISDISLDGMIVGGVHDALFEGNTVELDTPSGVKHSDGMQFYNSGTNDPLSNVVIRDNLIETHNGTSHGIYLSNGLANSTGNRSTFFQDVTIEGNTVLSGAVTAVSVGQTVGLTVQDNIVLQDTAFPSDRMGHIPAIRVDQAATDVSITDNIVHVAPDASGANWAPVKGGPPASWTISGNEIVSLGTTLDDVKAPPQPTNPPEPVKPDPIGNGQADAFMFDARGEKDVVVGLDFSEGDTIELYNYKGGTFWGEKGGNFLWVTTNGTIIDSVADLHELAGASPKVHISDGGNDKLVIDIDQPAGVHTIEIQGLAHDYFALA